MLITQGLTSWGDKSNIWNGEQYIKNMIPVTPVGEVNF